MNNMKPTRDTVFKPISELADYSDSEKYFCFAVVFSPETENDHFYGCPPYIGIGHNDYSEEEIYFEIPVIVAYYAKTHPGYTLAGLERRENEGARKFKNELKRLLDID